VRVLNEDGAAAEADASQGERISAQLSSRAGRGEKKSWPGEGPSRVEIGGLSGPSSCK